MTEDEVRAALSSADALGQEVEIVTDDCTVRCCGGQWRDRVGRQTYTGTIARLREGYVVIRWAPLGRIMEMMTATGFIMSVQPTSQEAPC